MTDQYAVDERGRIVATLKGLKDGTVYLQCPHRPPSYSGHYISREAGERALHDIFYNETGVVLIGADDLPTRNE